MICLRQEDKPISTDSPQEKIIALIPAYNEADMITMVVQGALRYLPVLVVDDGSQDETHLRAGAVGATVLRQYPNQGKGCSAESWLPLGTSCRGTMQCSLWMLTVSMTQMRSPGSCKPTGLVMLT
jgi:cellulose synthase/poly-beta-1,6-N-acetylglucosamine synthase-like glycosyltransferase